MKVQSKILPITFLVVYSLLFSATLFLTWSISTSAFDVWGASPEQLEKYPFGTEWGWAYCSKETYIAYGVIVFYVGLQNLGLSFLLYRLGKQNVVYRLGSLIMLLLPLYGAFYFAEMR